MFRGIGQIPTRENSAYRNILYTVNGYWLGPNKLFEENFDYLRFQLGKSHCTILKMCLEKRLRSTVCVVYRLT